MTTPSPFGLPALWAGARRWPMGGLLVVLLSQVMTMAMVAWLTRSLFMALGGSTPVSPPFAAVGLLMVCAVWIFASRLGERQLAERVAHDYAHDVRTRLLKQLSRMSQSQLQSRVLGQVTARLSGDMSSLRQWVSQGAPRLAVAGLALPGLSAVLIWLDPWLAAAALAPLTIALGVMATMGSALYMAQHDQRRERAILTLQTLERLRNAPALRQSGGLRQELRKLNRQADRVLPQSRKRVWLGAINRFLPDLGCGVGAALVLGTALVLDRPSANAAASLAALGLLSTVLSQLADVRDRWHAWVLSRQLLIRLLESPVEGRIESDKSSLVEAETQPVAPPWEIPVGFWGGEPYQLSPGQSLSVYGPTATGKSHWLRALAGLESCAEISESARLRLVSSLGPWMKGSLEKNLTLGIKTVQRRDGQTEMAIRRWGLTSLQERLAQTGQRIEEQGANLSTRERLLILLARTWIYPPDILLIDGGDWPLDNDMVAIIRTLMADYPTLSVVSVSAQPVMWKPDTALFQVKSHGSWTQTNSPVDPDLRCVFMNDT